MGGTLAIKTFRSADFAPAAQFTAWSECIGPMFDAAAPAPAPAAGFFAEYEAYVVGPLVIGRAAFDPHDYGRDAPRIARDGLKHYHVNLHVAGGYAARAGMREFETGPGDITLFDFAQPIFARSQRAELLVFAIPRDTLAGKLPAGDYHGRVLRGASPLGGLLGDFMRALCARLPQLNAEEASAAPPPAINMVAACFDPRAAGAEEISPAINALLTDRVRGYIDERLSGAEMSAEEICQALGLSRSTLYRLFEDMGGVARYVQNQRLARAFSILMTPGEAHRRVAEIAHTWGFKSESHFSRSFKAAFGVTPREVQAMALSGSPAVSRLAAAAAAGESPAAADLREMMAVVKRP